jgi:predicted TIM-barrel enzyme
MSSTTFSYEFNYETFKGKVNFPTGVFIDGQFSAGSDGTTIEYVVHGLHELPVLHSSHWHSYPVVSSIPVSRLHSGAELQMF